MNNMSDVQQWLQENPLVEHELIQGTQEWLDFRLEHDGSSEAAAMLGLSKTTTRTELLRMKSSGIAKEFCDWVQKNILDYGHEVEALARPIVAKQFGIRLFPLICSRGRPSASCDGITMDGTIRYVQAMTYWYMRPAAVIILRGLGISCTGRILY